MEDEIPLAEVTGSEDAIANVRVNQVDVNCGCVTGWTRLLSFCDLWSHSKRVSKAKKWIHYCVLGIGGCLVNWGVSKGGGGQIERGKEQTTCFG